MKLNQLLQNKGLVSGMYVQMKKFKQICENKETKFD